MDIRQPASALPRYQHMLNLPQFEEQPPARSHGNPSASAHVPVGYGSGATGTAHDVSRSEDSDAAVVENLQYNTPMAMYSSDNVVEALQGQTGGQISSVVGLISTSRRLYQEVFHLCENRFCDETLQTYRE